MKPSRLKKVVIALLLLLISGISLFAYGVISAGRSMSLVVGGKRVQGVVTRVEVTPEDKAYYSFVSFNDETGKSQVVRTISGSVGQVRYALGSNVTILYEPESPEIAKINDNESLWLGPIASLIGSNIILVVGCFLGFVTAIEVRLVGFIPILGKNPADSHNHPALP